MYHFILQLCNKILNVTIDVINDPDKNSNKILNLSSPFIEKAIYESCKIKKSVVEKDEKEMIEETLRVAVNNLHKKIDAEMEASMPSMPGLPF